MPTRLIIAFATIYIAWGSTYLAIRWAVETMPPLLMAAVRFAIAGGGLYIYLRLRGTPRPSRIEWRNTLPISFLLLGFGNGAICWAELLVPSGVTALLLASTPLWMVLAEAVAERRMPALRVLGGVLLGFGGVSLLIGTPGHLEASGPLLAAMLIILLASISWSAGSVWSRRLSMPRPAAMSTALQMLLASPFLLVGSVLRGELHGFSVLAVSGRSLAGFVYLIVGGSILGFGAFVFLLENTTPARTSTYAYVNPVIAVLLGWAVERERLGPHTLLAMVVIVASVIIVLRGAPRVAEDETAAPPPAE